MGSHQGGLDKLGDSLVDAKGVWKNRMLREKKNNEGVKGGKKKALKKGGHNSLQHRNIRRGVAPEPTVLNYPKKEFGGWNGATAQGN